MTHTRFPAHEHEGFVIGVVEKGIQMISHKGCVHLAKPGSLILLNPQEMHAVVSAADETVKYQTLQIPPAIIEKYFGQAVYFEQPVLHDSWLAMRVNNRINMMNTIQTSALSDENLSSIFMEIFTKMKSPRHLFSEMPVRFENDRIKIVLRYIDVHIQDSISVETLAGLLEMSQFHFIRFFKRATGFTPHVYIQAKRIARAKSMLRHFVSPSETAASFGFSDQSHLTKWLKACYGVTPGHYQLILNQPDCRKKQKDLQSWNKKYLLTS